jgi:fluoride ion exporter CrcB/FEX
VGLQPALNGDGTGGGRTSHNHHSDEQAPPEASSTSSTAPSSSGVVSSLFSGDGGGVGNFHEQLQEQIDTNIRPAILNFFYPPMRRGRRRDGRRQIVAAAESSDDDDEDYRNDNDRGAPHVGSGPERGIASPSSSAPPPNGGRRHSSQEDGDGGSEEQEQGYYDERQAKEDRRFVHHFWRTYDDVVILSLFTMIGILFRLATATYFTFFDSVFSNDTALFENLPLNCLSCFIMGLLCSGERLMEIVATRFTPSRLQHDVVRDDMEEDEEDDEDNTENVAFDEDESSEPDTGGRAALVATSSPASATTTTTTSSVSPKGRSPSMTEFHDPSHQALSVLRLRRRHRSRISLRGGGDGISGPGLTGGTPDRRRSSSSRKRRSYFHSWQPPVHLDSELREVQLLALERRIRASKCLLLFPVRKEDFDLMEHYFESGYKSDRRHGHVHLGSRIVVDGPSGHEDDGGDGDDNHGRSFSSYSGRGADLTYDLELQVELEDGGGRATYRGGGHDGRHVTFQDDGSRGCGTPTRNGRRPKSPRDSPQQNVVDRHHENARHADEERLVTVSLDAGTAPPCHSRRASHSAISSARDPSLHVPAPAVNGGHASGTCDDGAANVSTPSPSTQPAESATAEAVASPAEENLMVEEFFQDMHANVTENISRLQRVNLADGWDVGTTPDDMSDDLMLGLRDGFCGALSSFSSWNSAMVGLMRKNQIGEAFVGYMLGIQLPIIAYRFGQHVAVFVFIWRCRFETRRDERRGYGIRLSTNEISERDSDNGEDENGDAHAPGSNGVESSERKIPSVRAVATALFVMAVVTQCTALTFFSDPEKQLVALSLLFSPLGVLARWRLSRLNAWRPTFPLGTFASNIIACMLSGSLGQLLAGNPGPRERIVLVSIISGFGGTLSSLAAFIVEILAGIDPILFRFDGFFYAFASIFWAWLVGFLFSATADWADQTTSDGE